MPWIACHSQFNLPFGPQRCLSSRICSTVLQASMSFCMREWLSEVVGLHFQIKACFSFLVLDVGLVVSLHVWLLSEELLTHWTLILQNVAVDLGVASHIAQLSEVLATTRVKARVLHVLVPGQWVKSVTFSVVLIFNDFRRLSSGRGRRRWRYDLCHIDVRRLVKSELRQIHYS